MGFLTDDMTRLRDQITTLRGARETLMSGLAQGADARRQTMSEMRAGFRSALNDMNKRARAHCFACVSGIRKHVADLREGVAGDLEGARRAWMGK